MRSCARDVEWFARIGRLHETEIPKAKIMSQENTPGKLGTPMTPAAAGRIENTATHPKGEQSKDDGFAERARKAAERNVAAGVVAKDNDGVRK